MAAEIVMAVYRPKEGQGDAMAALIEKHVPLLRAEGLATQREPIVVRSKLDGTFIEIFEWDTADAAQAAHENPAVAALWREMESVADFLTLGDISEASVRFAHFDPA